MTDDHSAVPVAVMVSPAELDAARAMTDEVMVALICVQDFLAEQAARLPMPEGGRDPSLPFIAMERAVRDAHEREAMRVWELLARLSCDAEAREVEEAGRADA